MPFDPIQVAGELQQDGLPELYNKNSHPEGEASSGWTKDWIRGTMNQEVKKGLL